MWEPLRTQTEEQIQFGFYAPDSKELAEAVFSLFAIVLSFLGYLSFDNI